MILHLLVKLTFVRHVTSALDVGPFFTITSSLSHERKILHPKVFFWYAASPSLSLTHVSFQALITHYNDLGEGRFYDTRTRQSFRYDHLRKEASDYQSHPGGPPGQQGGDNAGGGSYAEAWRAALEEAWTQYARDHYRHGACAVYDRSTSPQEVTLVACLEDHQFQSQNFWWVLGW